MQGISHPAPAGNTATKTAQAKDISKLLPNGRHIPDSPKLETSLGKSLFFDPLDGQARLGDLRARLELKYAACLVNGKTNGCPLYVNRIKNLKLRAIAASGMIFHDRGWSVKDLLACTDGLEGPADSVLIASLEKPVWGEHDFYLFGLIEALESLQTLALGGGRTL